MLFSSIPTTDSSNDFMEDYMKFLDLEPSTSEESTATSENGATAFDLPYFAGADFKPSTLFSGTLDNSGSQNLGMEDTYHDDLSGIMFDFSQSHPNMNLFTRRSVSPLSLQSSTSSATSYTSFLPSDGYSPIHHSLSNDLDNVLNQPYLGPELADPLLSPITALTLESQNFSALGRTETISVITPSDGQNSGSSDTIVGPIRRASSSNLEDTALSPQRHAAAPLNPEIDYTAITSYRPIPGSQRLSMSQPTRESSPLSSIPSARSSPAPLPSSSTTKSGYLRRSARKFKPLGSYNVDGLAQPDVDDVDEYPEETASSVLGKRLRDSHAYVDFDESESYDEGQDEPSPKKQRPPLSTKAKRPTRKSKGSSKMVPCSLGCSKVFSRNADNKRHCQFASIHQNEEDINLCIKKFHLEAAAVITCEKCGDNLSREDARKRHEKKLSCGKRTTRRKTDRVDED